MYFFSLSVTQQMKLQRQINIALKKVCTGRITAGMLSHNFSDTVKSFIANDEAYHFMNTIKGTPAYWKRFLYEALAMVKQLGILVQIYIGMSLFPLLPNYRGKIDKKNI